MDDTERRAIDQLFDRVSQAEQRTPVRDQAAHTYLNGLIARQPTAPYYMAQALIVQEYALEQMTQRIEQLEAELRQATQPAPRSGGFLSGLLGGGGRAPSPEQRQGSVPATTPNSVWGRPSGAVAPAMQPPPGYGSPQQPQQGYGGGGMGGMPMMGGGMMGGGGGRSFLGGALQTAMGVAGGVVAANAISGLFSGHSGAGAAHAASPAAAAQSFNPGDATSAGFDNGGAWATDAGQQGGGDSWAAGDSSAGYDDGGGAGGGWDSGGGDETF